MRGSDGRLRRNYCIEMLRTNGGLTVSKAAARVGRIILGKTTSIAVKRIRLDYYEYRNKLFMDPVFFSQFLSWRAWVLKSSEEDLQFFLGKYGKQFGLHRRQRLAQADRGSSARPGADRSKPGMAAIAGSAGETSDRIQPLESRNRLAVPGNGSLGVGSIARRNRRTSRGHTATGAGANHLEDPWTQVAARAT